MKGTTRLHWVCKGCKRAGCKNKYHMIHFVSFCPFRRPQVNEDIVRGICKIEDFKESRRKLAEYYTTFDPKQKKKLMGGDVDEIVNALLRVEENVDNIIEEELGR